MRWRLGAVVGPGAEAVRVHRDADADRFARARRADAVTVGRHVFFRQGRFRPEEPEGFALLAHEATHVLAALRPNAAWRRATVAGAQEEEQGARARERALLGRPFAAAPRLEAAPGPLAQRPAPLSVAPLPTPPAASSAALTPMAAATDRHLDGSEPTGAPATVDVDELRRNLYRDLMSQIRADLERGG
jgi:hypothetical protein